MNVNIKICVIMKVDVYGNGICGLMLIIIV